MFSFFTPEILKGRHAIAEAPAPLTTIFTSSIFFFEISNAFIRAAVVIIAVPFDHHEILECLKFFLIFVL